MGTWLSQTMNNITRRIFSTDVFLFTYRGRTKMSLLLLQLSLFAAVVIKLTSSQSTYDVTCQDNDVTGCGSSGQIVQTLHQLVTVNSQLVNAVSQLQIPSVSSRLLQSAESQPGVVSGWTGMSITTQRCSSTRHQGRTGTGCSCWMAWFRQRQYMDLFRAFTQLRVYLALPRLSTECARNPCLYLEALYLSMEYDESPDMAIKCTYSLRCYSTSSRMKILSILRSAISFSLWSTTKVQIWQ